MHDRDREEDDDAAATGDHANMPASVIHAPTSSSSNRRAVLPATRQSVTHKFAIAGHEGYLTIGLFDEPVGNNAGARGDNLGGRPGEIFIKMSKEGSTLSGLIQGFCRAFSLALQYGLSVQDACDRFRGMRFDPMGPTSNPDIPEALSILDYVARYLELHYCSPPTGEPTTRAPVNKTGMLHR
jgi:ribonucleoside-diphosphate reductase alpha chain